MSLRTAVFVASLLFSALQFSARLVTAEPVASAKVVLERHEDRVAVTIDGEEFTSYRFTGHDKPILSPLRAPGGVPLTRSWPIEKGVAGEPEDHPHHESLWFTHGSVNGHDFWAPRAHGAGPDGPIPHVEHVSIDRCESGETAILETTSRWVDADSKPLLTEHRTMVFSADETARSIDVTLDGPSAGQCDERLCAEGEGCAPTSCGPPEPKNGCAQVPGGPLVALLLLLLEQRLGRRQGR
jgi:hypothetical protein